MSNADKFEAQADALINWGIVPPVESSCLTDRFVIDALANWKIVSS